MKAKIGKFGFVNNFLPYYRLEKEGIKTVTSSPGELAGMLERKEIDFAPVPSFYYLKNKEMLRNYEFCVASKGQVLSVIVVSNKKGLDDGSIAITDQTMTSLNLLKIILKEKGMKNEIVLMNESRAADLLKHCSHALVIGDEAIKARMMYRVVMDLGEEWHELTGYPMVFGISASFKEKDMSEIDRKVMESVTWGEKNIGLIAAEAEEKFKLQKDFLEIYFKTLIHRMGAKEVRGLELFEEKCHQYGLL